MSLRLARDAVEDNDAVDVIEMIDEIKLDVQTVIAELRALADGIFPPLLVSGGLCEALPAAGGAGAALPTTVDFDGVGRYGNDIEAAVYFAHSRRSRMLANTRARMRVPRCTSPRLTACCASRSATMAPDSKCSETLRLRLREHGRPAGCLRRRDRGDLDPGAGTMITGTIPLPTEA